MVGKQQTTEQQASGPSAAAARTRNMSFVERRLAPIRTDSPTASPRRVSLRDATLRRSVSNVKYGSFLETLKQAEEQAARTKASTEANQVSSYKRASFLNVGGRDEVAGSPAPHLEEKTGDVIVMGTLLGATLSRNSTLGWGRYLWCEWKVVNSDKWSIVRGMSQGVTHKAAACSQDGMFVWQNPVNLLLRTTTSFDWPKLCFTLYEHNILMATDSVFGYGLVNLPLTPGCHSLEAQCWRPASRTKCHESEVGGLRPELSKKSLIWDREGPYMNVQTIGIGKIDLQLNLVFSKSMEEIFDNELTEANLVKEDSKDLQGLQEDNDSEGLRIVRSRRGKRFNEVTSALVASNMLRSGLETPKGGRTNQDAKKGPAMSIQAVAEMLSPADQARADRRERMRTLMQDRAQRRAERAQRKTGEQEGKD